MLRYIACVLGGLCIGVYLTQNQLEKHYLDGLNAGYEEAKEKFAEAACQRCDERDGILQSMPDDEFDVNPEALIAASEAMEKYQGEGVQPGFADGIATQPSVTAQAAVVEASTHPLVKQRIEELSNSEGRVDYHKASSSEPVVSPSRKADEYVPATITMDEWVRNEVGYKQFSITYFAADDILAGESDQVVDLETRNVTLGDEILKMLQAGPEAMGGNTTLFIQNDREEVSLEIAWKPGRYSDLNKTQKTG